MLVLKDGAAAVIYSDNGITPATNPLTTDANGSFTFYGPTGNYSLTITSPKLPGPVEYIGIPILDQDDFDFTLRDDLASEASAKGSELVAYIPSGTGAVAATVQSKLREFVSVKDFGAVGDGVADDTAAFSAAIAYVLAAANRPAIHVPAGKYVVDAIALDSARGLAFIGEPTRDSVASNGKTWIYWKAGSTANALLTIKSCANITFSDINFFTNGNSGKDQMVLFQCNSLNSLLPKNKFASSYVSFIRCGFIVPSAGSCTVATIYQKSTIQVFYDACDIFGARSVKLGADTDVDPVNGDPTIPDGRTVLTRFVRGTIRGDIVRERVLGVSYDGVYFGENSVPVSGTDKRISAMTVSGNQEVRTELLLGCIIDTAEVQRNASVFYTGPSAPPTNVEPSLTVIGGQYSGAGTLFDLSSGIASIQGVRFLAQNMAGATTFRAVRLNSGLRKFETAHNDYDGLLALNSASVVATAVEDLRTSFEDRTYLLARSRTTDLALTNNNFTTVLSSTVDRIEGGVLEVSYHVTISSAIDSVFTAKLQIDGVDVPGTFARDTTNTTAAKTFILSLPRRLVKVAATNNTSTRTIAVLVQQNAGATFATIRGESFALSDTFACVKVVA